MFTACGIMHRPAASPVHYTTSCNTQSSAPEDGRNYRPKHVELIGIINKPLLLHLVVVYIIEYLTLTHTLCHPFDIRGNKQHIPCFIPYTRSFRIRWEDTRHVYKENVPQVCA